jgi:hypothetical protein
MASGKKNYFRHSTSAFEDPKIQKAISLLGYEGYAYYFILLELFAKQCENEFKNPIVIHQQTVRIVLRKSQQSCHKVVTKLQESGLFVVTFTESFYEFHIPNLAKYLGKYETKIDSNSPNKRKEKENKIKESKIYKNITPDEVIQIYNETVQGKLKPFTAHLAGSALTNFFEASQYLKTGNEWKSLFEKVLQSDFLLGRTDSKWTVNFLWLVDYDNALKVISGNFDNEQADYSYLFEGIKDA